MDGAILELKYFITILEYFLKFLYLINLVKIMENFKLRVYIEIKNSDPVSVCSLTPLNKESDEKNKTKGQTPLSYIAGLLCQLE